MTSCPTTDLPRDRVLTTFGTAAARVCVTAASNIRFSSDFSGGLETCIIIFEGALRRILVHGV